MLKKENEELKRKYVIFQAVYDLLDFSKDTRDS